MLAQEDCASRSLVKEEVPDQDEGLDMNDGEENGEKLNEDNGQAGEAGMEGESASVPKSSGPSEYVKNKLKNIEELKRRLEEVNAMYPMDEFKPEKKKAKQTSRKSGSREEPIVRRESSRIKDKRLARCDLCDTCLIILPSAATSAVTTTAAPSSTTKASDGVGLLQEPVNAITDNNTSICLTTATASNNVSAMPTIDQSQAPLAHDSTALAPLAHNSSAFMHIEHAPKSVSPSDGLTATDGNGSGGISSPTQVHATTTLHGEPAASATNSFPSTNAGVSEDHATDISKASLQSSGCEGQVGDADMQDVMSSNCPSSGYRVDEDIPSWLTSMIGYLRGLSEDVTWQTLVTEFLDFEKRGPPHGVSSIPLYH